MDRAELGALRDAIDTILSWPDPVRDQIAQWLQPKTAKPNAAHHGTPSSRSSRHRGVGPGVEEAACELALLDAIRDHPEAGVVQWAKATQCEKSAVSMRLGDWRGAASSSVTAKGAGGSPRRTLRCRRHSDGGGGGQLLAPVAVACPQWVTPIAASISRDVQLRTRPGLFGGERGTMSLARFG